MSSSPSKRPSLGVWGSHMARSPLVTRQMSWKRLKASTIGCGAGTVTEGEGARHQTRPPDLLPAQLTVVQAAPCPVKR